MTLNTHLTHLQTSGLIQLAQEFPELEYLFRHALVRDAAYDSLLLSERKRLHQIVGEALEELHPDQLDTVAPLLGQHYAQAGNTEKAVHYLLEAGDQARSQFAHNEAIIFYEQALGLLPETQDFERLARIWMKLGLTHHNAFDFQKARLAYEKGFALWQQASSTDLATASQSAPYTMRVSYPEPLMLDPSLAHDLNSAIWVDQLFSGLVSINADMDIVPEIASSWQLFDNGYRYLFHLRDDAFWSDGEPVTAVDFEFAWKRLLTLDMNQSAFLYKVIKGMYAYQQGEVPDLDQIGVQALDDTTLQIELEQPTSYFLQLLTHPLTYPVPKKMVQQHGQEWAQPDNLVTNGPYQLASWTKELIALTRNPLYKGHRRGNVYQIEAAFHHDDADKLALYENDQLDIIDVWSFPVVLKNRVREKFAGELISWPTLVTSFLELDPTQPPFADVRVRQALAMTVDREGLAHIIGHGYETPATGGFVPPGIPGHSPEIGLPFDPEQAQMLLAKAGYENGRNFPTIKGLIPTTPRDYRPEAAFLQKVWHEHLGITIDWDALDFPSLLEQLYRQTPPIFLFAWTADFPEVDNFLRTSSESPRHRWSNRRYDELIKTARKLMNQRQRLALYQQAEEILIEEAAIIPLSYMRWQTLIKPWVKRYPTSPLKWWYWKDVVIEPHRVEEVVDDGR